MDSKIEELNEELAVSADESGIAPGEIVIGELLSFDDHGRPLVIFNASDNKPVSALSTVAVTHEHKGRQVALLFADGELSKPVIMGLIHSPLLDILDNIEFERSSTAEDKEPIENSSHSSISENSKSQLDSLPNSSGENTAYIDGQKIVLEGHEEIELRCGEASIRLTKAGKILIRGKYLLNRSSGVNRIMGGSVQVN